MYLKPTQALWGQIENKIEAMFKERITYALNWYHYGLNKHDFDKRCMASIIPPEEDVLVQQLGSRWLSEVDDISISISNGQRPEQYSLPAKIGGRKGYTSAHWNGYSDGNRPKVTDPVILDIAKRRHEAHAKIMADKEAFKKSVADVWNDAPSINALAKIWPPIVDLLPADIVQKLEKKTTRRTAKQMAENVDTKNLSVHILKAKVAQ